MYTIKNGKPHYSLWHNVKFYGSHAISIAYAIFLAFVLVSILLFCYQYFIVERPQDMKLAQMERDFRMATTCSKDYMRDTDDCVEWEERFNKRMRDGR